MEFKNAFGSVPEGFSRRMDETLLNLRQKRGARRGAGGRARTLVLIAAMLTVLAGAVCAAEAFGLSSFFERFYPGLARTLPVTQVSESWTVGQAAFTVQEAFADGRTVYVSLAVRAREGACMMPEAAEIAGERRAMLTASAALEGSVSQSTEILRQEDGSWQVVLIAPLATENRKAKLTVSCASQAFIWTDNGASPLGDSAESQQALTIPVTKACERWTARAVGKAEIGKTGARIAQVSFMRTPIALYYDVQVEGELPKNAACAFVDGAGELLTEAPGTLRGLLDGALPDGTARAAMRLRFFDFETKETLGVVWVE